MFITAIMNYSSSYIISYMFKLCARYRNEIKNYRTNQPEAEFRVLLLLLFNTINIYH